MGRYLTSPPAAITLRSGPTQGGSFRAEATTLTSAQMVTPATRTLSVLVSLKLSRRTYVAGISGATVADGVTVVVGANGHLGTVTSSARYKEGVEPMDHSSEAILSLKPVRFRYKKELDPKGIPQFGLVAEQVEKVNPDLVARDEQGEPYTVRYEAVNAMLLNEFLKEHRKVEEQSGKQQKLEATVAQQQDEIQALTAALKAQAAQIQQVNARLPRMQAPARMASNQ